MIMVSGAVGVQRAYHAHGACPVRCTFLLKGDDSPLHTPGLWGQAHPAPLPHVQSPGWGCSDPMQGTPRGRGTTEPGALRVCSILGGVKRQMWAGRQASARVGWRE